jgi:predicted DNA-binding protein (UPF0251 family)
MGVSLPGMGRRRHRGHHRGCCRPGRPPVPRILEVHHSGVVYLPFQSEPHGFQGEPVVLYEDEVEAMRLAYLEGLDVKEASSRMGVSEATYWRLLDSARRKLAEAIVYRKPFKISERSLP